MGLPKKTVICELEGLRDTWDRELAHAQADNFLLDYLRETGSEEVAEAFEETRDQLGFKYD